MKHIFFKIDVRYEHKGVKYDISYVTDGETPVYTALMNMIGEKDIPYSMITKIKIERLYLANEE